MAQYRTGTANFTSGSQTVTGNGTLWSSNAASSDLIVKTGDLFPTVIATVVSDTQLTLNANYAGATSTASGYQITSDFTSNLNLPLIFDGDLGTPELIRDAFEKLDTQLGGGFTNPLLAPSGSAGAPGLSWSSDTDTGHYLIGAGNIGLAIGGTKLIDYSDESVVVSGDVTAENISKSAIDKIVDSTANLVDVKIYDTTKDSDGGAWRNKTQHTSWYNEALNTATRGATRKFPEIALIVAETDKVTIHDITKADCPVWRTTERVGPGGLGFWRNVAGIDATSVKEKDGKLVIGLRSETISASSGCLVMDFVADKLTRYSTTNSSCSGLAITEDTSATATMPKISTEIVQEDVNDLAITTRAGAEIDPVTKLPYPTIAVATASGGSWINRDGSLDKVDEVIDATGAVNLVAAAMGTDGFTIYCAADKVYIFETIPAVDTALTSADYIFDTAGTSGPHISGVISSVVLKNSDGSGNAEFIIGSDDGLFQVDYVAGGANSVISHTSNEFSTGAMKGDVVGCWMADSVAGTITGTELVANGGFDVDLSGWTPLNESSFTAGSGVATLVNNGTVYGKAYRAISTVIGKEYVVSADVTTLSAGRARLFTTTSLPLAGDATLSNIGESASAGVTLSGTFTATSTTTYIGFGNRNDNNVSSSWDNISVREAIPDRSVKGNDLAVNGTISRAAVATGAELVFFGPFSAANNITSASNSDWDVLGTGAVSLDITFQSSGTATDETIFSIANAGNTIRLNVVLKTDGTIDVIEDGSTAAVTTSSSLSYDDGVTHQIQYIRTSSVARELFVDGVSVADNTTDAGSLSDSGNLPLAIGCDADGSSNPALTTKIAFVKISATAKTDAQVRKVQTDEKWLFRDNALATLQGTSDAVAGVSYDSDTDKIDVATADGTTTLINLLPIAYTDQSGTQTSDTMVAVDRVNDTVAFANAAEVVIEKPQEDL